MPRVMPSSIPRHVSRSSVVLAGVLAAAALLRLLGLEKGYWLDEAFTLRVVVPSSLHDALRALVVEQSPPSYFLALRAWALAGDAEWWLRLFSALPAIAALGLVAFALERTRPTAGVLALVLMAPHPMLLRYAQELRPYAWLLAAQAVVLVAAARLRDRPDDRRWCAVLAGGLIVSGMVHFLGLLLVPAAAILIGLASGTWRSLMARPVTGALAMGLLVPAAAFVAQSHWSLAAGGEWWMPSPSLSLATRLATQVGSYWADPAVGLTDAPFPLAAAHGLLLAGLLVSAASGRSRVALAWVAAAATVAVALALISLAIRPILVPRSLLLLLPLLAGATSLQIASLRRPAFRRLGWASAVGLAMVGSLSWIAVFAWQPIEPWPQVARIVEAAWRPGDLVVVVPNYAARGVAANLSRRRTIPLHGVPLGGGHRAGDDLASVLRTGAADGRLFLVIRIDLSSRARMDAVHSVIDAALTWRHEGRAAEVLVVTSHDAGLEPALHDDARRLVSNVESQSVSSVRRELGPLLTVVSAEGAPSARARAVH
jgi:mannosyltransferase